MIIGTPCVEYCYVGISQLAIAAKTPGIHVSPTRSTMARTGWGQEEAHMFWVFAAVTYLIAVVTIVRFFQFVSQTDRSIRDFWNVEDRKTSMAGDGMNFSTSPTRARKQRGQTKSRTSKAA